MGQITITIDDHGNLQMKCTVADKLRAVGALEQVKDMLIDPEKYQSKQSPILRGVLVPNVPAQNGR